ncbi:MAG TPA: hypothetical protein P5268_02705 [Candidatus Marinimicrobia bacterium]|nr:hypothetical protein [Candidatus Neomarinimicrobiota bacterium]HRS51942.1 hypothetical protein [Candidatus Neomarinimicrobiota bacterium]HRU91929.1 hypothetical protein [Candidatus Neomarinimicrobiota bacterium]
MFKKGLVLLVLVSAVFAQSNPPSIRPDSVGIYFNMSIQAYSEQQYDRYLEYTQKILQVYPDDFTLQYNLASAYALNKDTINAIKTLNSLVDKGLGLVAEDDPDFADLKNTPEFRALVKKIEKVKKPVKSSKKAFTVTEKDLFPRGISYDPAANNIYLSSLYKSKIVRIDRNGKVTDFTPEGQDGLGPVTAIWVDPQRRILWALSSFGIPNEKTPRELAGTAAVYKYNLDKGQLIKRYDLPRPHRHFLTNLVDDRDGNLYVADSGWRTIFRLDAQKDTLEKFLELYKYPQLTGLTITPDGKNLFVSYASGILNIEVANGKITPLTSPEHILLVGCDGLYFHNNSLIAIQTFLNRIVRFELSPDFSRVTNYKIIESNNPDFNIPSGGAIDGKYFYYVANSQINILDRSGKVMTPEQLKDILIFKAKL